MTKLRSLLTTIESIFAIKKTIESRTIVAPVAIENVEGAIYLGTNKTFRLEVHDRMMRVKPLSGR